jgi:glycosyltransferase involved in cell wall biosynthesis
MRMKVLVFAHTPPPHHGQSYMVQLMLENAGLAKGDGSDELIFFHVNARLSEDMEDVGSWRIGKLFLLLGYIFQSWWLRLTQAPDILYYVPAPAKRSAIYRDWLVLILVAPLFRARVYHWHSIGLGQWVVESVKLGLIRRSEAAVTRRLYAQNELSIVLTEQGRGDAEIFSPRRINVVPNGIPDPCPDFAKALLPLRLSRARERKEKKTPIFELLFLAHATRAKGLFDAIEAVARANAHFAAGPVGEEIRLTVAGAFLSHEEEQLFQERIRREDALLPSRTGPAVVYAGYAGPEEKDRLLRASDALCFASYFPNEAQPVSVIEALAYGLPVILSRWRGLPDMVSPLLAHLTEPNDPASLTQALSLVIQETRFEEYRNWYLERYSLPAFRHHLRDAFFLLSK